MKNYLHECTVLTIKTTIWKTSKKEKNRLDSWPNFEAGVENRGSHEGRSINFTGIYLWHSGRGIEFVRREIYRPTRRKTVDFASTIEKKKKKWKDRSFQEKVRRFQTRLDKTIRCGGVEKHCVIT